MLARRVGLSVLLATSLAAQGILESIIVWVVD